MTEDELRRCMNDPLWRLTSGALYKIITKGDDEAEGLVIPFVPNAAQMQLLGNLHHRNVILKARQLGFCVSPETRVLTAELKWIPIGEISPGTEVVAVDEHVPGGRGSARKMRTATVEAVKVMTAERYKISFDDGRHVICTDRHPWLSRKVSTDAKWRSISGEGNSVTGRLTVGTRVRWVTKPWGDPTIEDGWFGGMLDGEGSIAKTNTSAGINVSQRHGAVWDRLVRYADERDYNARIESDAAERKSKHGRVPVPKLAFGRMDEIFQLIGQTRPTRFLGNRFWEGRELPGKRNGDVGWSAITSIEPIGVGDVVDMQTTTGTYIAEGFVSHNTTLVAILWLDTALFSKDPVRCGIIAQDREAAEIIFRDKVKFAYDHLPEQLRAAMPLARDSASELLFGHNGSSVRVATSMRSGTIHRLHISEFGKICAKFPDKANEVVTGSIPAVPKSGVLIIESTAEGRDGDFYKITQDAIKARDSAKDLNERDYRFHFFPWFDAPEYRMDPDRVLITPADHEYFDALEAAAGVTIAPEQRAWYVATRDADFSGDEQKMWQEYPSCIAGDVMVGTPNGIMPIRDVVADGHVIHAHMHKGIRPVFEIRTRLGYTVTCTEDHPVKMQSGAFKKICDGLAVGDRVAIGRPMLSTAQQSVSWNPVPFVDGEIKITPEFAEFLGVFMGDGSFYDGSVSVACDAGDADTVKAVEAMFDKYLGGGSWRVTGSKQGCIEVRKANVAFSAPMLALGIVEQRTTGGLKRKVHVPSYIFRSPKPVVSAFLRGLFEADGFAARDGTSIKFFSKYGYVVRDVQLLLLAMGIESRASEQKKISGSGSEYTGWELVLRADGVRKFAAEIGFISKRKQDRANLSLSKRKHGKAVFDWSDEIVSILPAGTSDVYDITTESHEFDAGGIVVHNCPEEAFQKSTEGCYYTKQITAARKERRITRLPLLPGVPCNTFWDIGNSDGTAIWVHQRVGAEHRFVRFFEGWGEPYSHFVSKLQELGVVWGVHYLPHDADHVRQGQNVNKSPKQMLEELMPGARWEIVPRIDDVNWGINQTRDAFPACFFDEEHCKDGLIHLESYRKQWNTRQACFSDVPLHDIHSEASDAFRQFGQALASGQLQAGTGGGWKRKPSQRRSV